LVSGKQVDLVAVANKSAHTLASLLKLYFTKLKPEPLLTLDLYESLVVAMQEEDPERQRQIVAQLLSLLPSINFKILTVLMLHLQLVTQHSAVNKMDSTNLAIVFGPILLGSRHGNAAVLLADVTHAIRLVSLLIQECDFFFPDRQVKIAEKASPDPVASKVKKKKEEEKKEREKKERKEKQEKKEKKAKKEDQHKEWNSEGEKKKRGNNIKKFNEQWSQLSAGKDTAPPSPVKAKKEKKQEKIERKQRKARQQRINERWERMMVPASPPQQHATPKRNASMKEKERLESIYSQRSSQSLQTISIDEFLQEHIQCIKSGNYTYDELLNWLKALHKFSLDAGATLPTDNQIYAGQKLILLELPAKQE